MAGAKQPGETKHRPRLGQLGRLTPFRLFLPDTKDLSLWLTASKVTSDFIVDRLEEWWQRRRENYRDVRTLPLDLDNGPENHCLLALARRVPRVRGPV